MTASNTNKRGLWTGTSVERDALTAADGLLLGDEFWDTAGGKAWWDGAAWREYTTNGTAHVKLPQNVFGTVSVGELAGTGSPVTTAIPFAAGIVGATVTVHLVDDAMTGASSSLFYVAFNNTAFANPESSGNRFVVAVGESMSFNFESATTKPTIMYLRTTAAADIHAFYVVAED